MKTELPPISFFIEKVKRKEFFSFCKLNHAFWEAALSSPLKIGEEKCPAWTPQGWFQLHGQELMDELLAIVKDIHNTKIMLGVSHLGPPDEKLSKEINIYERCSPDQIKEFINKQFSSNYQLYFGQIWKHYTIHNEMLKLFQSIREMPVIVVGLTHLKDVGANLKFRNFRHLEIDLSATANRLKILEEIKILRRSIECPVTILFQSGESLSTWFIYHLQELENTFLIDVGRALDVWAGDPQEYDAIPDMKNQQWQKLIIQAKIYI
jgi:hypothetical protein